MLRYSRLQRGRRETPLKGIERRRAGDEAGVHSERGSPPLLRDEEERSTCRSRRTLASERASARQAGYGNGKKNLLATRRRVSAATDVRRRSSRCAVKRRTFATSTARPNLHELRRTTGGLEPALERPARVPIIPSLRSLPLLNYVRRDIYLYKFVLTFAALSSLPYHHAQRTAEHSKAIRR